MVTATTPPSSNLVEGHAAAHDPAARDADTTPAALLVSPDPDERGHAAAAAAMVGVDASLAPRRLAGERRHRLGTAVALVTLVGIGMVVVWRGGRPADGAEAMLSPFGALGAAGWTTWTVAVAATAIASIGAVAAVPAWHGWQRGLALVAHGGRAVGIVPAALAGLIARSALPGSRVVLSVVLGIALAPTVAVAVADRLHSLRAAPHVQTARGLGASPTTILRRHLAIPLAARFGAAAAAVGATVLAVVACLDLVGVGTAATGWGTMLRGTDPSMRVGAATALTASVAALRVLARRGGAE